MNTVVHNEILGVVNKQIKTNNPKETRLTFNRLVEEGYSELDAKKLLAQCVLAEMMSVFKDRKPFNLERFTKNLNRFPKFPK